MSRYRKIDPRTFQGAVAEAIESALPHLMDVMRSILEIEGAFLCNPPEHWMVESPLEAAFSVHWQARHISAKAEEDCYLPRLRPQEKIGQYRVDFVVAWQGRTLPVAVELDGHDFHERTKEQVARRDSRDRELQAAGWKVFHFSGSEFLRNPTGCVDEVWSYSVGLCIEIDSSELLEERPCTRES